MPIISPYQYIYNILLTKLALYDKSIIIDKEKDIFCNKYTELIKTPEKVKCVHAVSGIDYPYKEIANLAALRNINVLFYPHDTIEGETLLKFDDGIMFELYK